MSGHNKWSQIKHKKAASDGKKSQLFSRLVKEISVQARLANGNENAAGLRAAIEKARAANMPSDNISRAIKKAAETKENLERIVYEAYGPGSVAMVIEALTESRNRASAEVKHILSLHGASLGAPGSVTWAFSKHPDGSWSAIDHTALSDEDATKLDALLEDLDACEDIQSVVTNSRPSENTL